MEWTVSVGPAVKRGHQCVAGSRKKGFRDELQEALPARARPVLGRRARRAVRSRHRTEPQASRHHIVYQEGAPPQFMNVHPATTRSVPPALEPWGNTAAVTDSKPVTLRIKTARKTVEFNVTPFLERENVQVEPDPADKPERARLMGTLAPDGNRFWEQRPLHQTRPTTEGTDGHPPPREPALPEWLATEKYCPSHPRNYASAVSASHCGVREKYGRCVLRRSQCLRGARPVPAPLWTSGRLCAGRPNCMGSPTVSAGMLNPPQP